MSAAVIAHWDLPEALQNPFAQKKLLTRWTHTLKAFGVHHLTLIDVDGLQPFIGDMEIVFSVADNLETALAMYPRHSPVYVEQGGQPLKHFLHPTEPVYIFGSDFHSLPKATVEFPSEIPVHAEIAAGIILQHGYSKWR